MKIFKRNSQQTATFEQLVERQDRLTLMRSEAQAALVEALAERQSHLIAGDVDDKKGSEALQFRVDSAQSELLGLDDALAALVTQIADAEAAQSATQRRVKAEANAKALAVAIANVRKTLPGWLAAAREMSEQLETLNNFRYQVGGVAGYLSNVANETGVGLGLVLDDLSAAVDAVARGEQAITIGKPEPAPAPAAPVKDIFTYTIPPSGPSYRVPNAFSKETR